MLVTISIVAILGAAMALAVSGAQESAQIAKTRSLIARLNTLVMQKYESYAHRRLPIVIPSVVLDSSGNEISTPLPAIAKVRCDAVRQLMRMEMPDRWTDITDIAAPIKVVDPGTMNPYNDVATERPAVVTMQPTASSAAYLAFHNSVADSNAFLQRGDNHPSAKCLYLLVTMGLEESDVLENFSEGDIADIDGTGCKVFLDAWGNPIEFLRWAPGFISPLQPAAPTGAQKDQRGADQTDPTGVYTTWTKGGTFALYPLIYSGGPDGRPDIVSDTNNAVASGFHYATWNNNPFVGMPTGTLPPTGHTLVPTPLTFTDGPFGAPAVFPKRDRGVKGVGGRALGNSDNIHNHTIGAR